MSDYEPTTELRSYTTFIHRMENNCSCLQTPKSNKKLWTSSKLHAKNNTVEEIVVQLEIDLDTDIYLDSEKNVGVLKSLKQIAPDMPTDFNPKVYVKVYSGPRYTLTEKGTVRWL